MEDEIDQNKVYFVCKKCGFVFQDDPYFFPIKCPQCGSEDTART
jgi:predicted Zn-ribbon and HTH transcriptional regulator